MLKALDICLQLPPFSPLPHFLAPLFINLFLAISISRDKTNYMKLSCQLLLPWLCACSAKGRKHLMKVLPRGMPSGEDVQPNMRKCEM